MPHKARHQTPTSTTSTFYTLAGQSRLHSTDNSMAHEAIINTIHSRETTCFDTTFGESVPALNSADGRGTRTSFARATAQHDSEGTSYPRGALLAAMPITTAPEQHGPTSSVLALAPISTTHFASTSTQNYDEDVLRKREQGETTRSAMREARSETTERHYARTPCTPARRHSAETTAYQSSRQNYHQSTNYQQTTYRSTVQKLPPDNEPTSQTALLPDKGHGEHV